MSDEETRQSRFNAGVAMTERIDALQRAINASRFNPLAQNPEVGKFNYEVMVAANDGLLAEAWSKLTDDEKEQGTRIKNVIHSFLELNPIILNIRGDTKVNNVNLKQFMELITLYENTNKILLDKHSLNSPDQDDDEGL